MIYFNLFRRISFSTSVCAGPRTTLWPCLEWDRNWRRLCSSAWCNHAGVHFRKGLTGEWLPSGRLPIHFQSLSKLAFFVFTSILFWISLFFPGDGSQLLLRLYQLITFKFYNFMSLLMHVFPVDGTRAGTIWATFTRLEMWRSTSWRYRTR